jgi:hypothetical protein
VLPYGTLTGMSSVALQSAMYGAVIVASDTPGFRRLQEEGFNMRLYEWQNKHSLIKTLEDAIDSSEEARQQDARQNLEYCRRQPMNAIVDNYLDIAERLKNGKGSSSDRQRSS